MTPERFELIREAWARNRETGVRALRSGYPYQVAIPGPAMEVDLHFMGSELLFPPVAPVMIEHIEFTPQTRISPQREHSVVMCEGEEIECFSEHVDICRARLKSLALLKSWLSPEQLNQYNKAGWFEVIGGSTGTRYRIDQPSAYNVARLDDKREATDRLCVEARGEDGFPLASGDIMLAQKIALEKNELPTLRIANWITISGLRQQPADIR